MTTPALPRLALVWAQFSAYHMDRCEAVGRRFAGRADVLAVEVASASDVYAWPPSGNLAAASKVTLFPGRSYERISRVRRFVALLRAVWRCRMVCLGIGYNEAEVIVLSWVLRALGVKVVMMTDSKFDDMQRRAGFEFLKRLVLTPYNAAIVAGSRSRAYVRFLGFRRRMVLLGYDVVSIGRLRAQAGVEPAPGGAPFAQRPFLYVGRFVDKKNLFELVDGYARYVEVAGGDQRKLVLAGSGVQEEALRQRVEAYGLNDRVEFPGFLDAPGVAKALADALALILVSGVEQWGLVVNEALALGLPVIVSEAVGARDTLARNLVNALVVETGSTAAIAAAMTMMAADEQQWRAMAEASGNRAWLGDVERFADAVETMFSPHDPACARRSAEWEKFAEPHSR